MSPEKLAFVSVAELKRVFFTVDPRKSADPNFVLPKSVLVRSVFRKLASVSVAPPKFTPVRFSPTNDVPAILAFRRSRPLSVAPRKMTLVNELLATATKLWLVRLALVKSVPFRMA